MVVNEDRSRRFLIVHVRAAWLWIAIADCLKRIKISGCAGGLPAILCFSIVPWKNTLPTYLSAGRYAIISCANLLTQGPLHGMFLLLISKPAFYRWLIFAISWRLYNRRNGLPQHSSSTSRCFADHERRNDEGLCAPAVPDLHIDLL